MYQQCKRGRLLPAPLLSPLAMERGLVAAAVAAALAAVAASAATASTLAAATAAGAGELGVGDDEADVRQLFHVVNSCLVQERSAEGVQQNGNAALVQNNVVILLVLLNREHVLQAAMLARH